MVYAPALKSGIAAEMHFRFGRVHVAKVLPARQSSGVVLLMYSFGTAALATDSTSRIHSENHGSCLGPVAADDDADPDFLSGLWCTAGSA
jgi:hypothetical protein